MGKVGAGLLHMGQLARKGVDDLREYANRFYERQNRAFSRALKAGIDPAELGLSRPKKPGKNLNRNELLENVKQNYERTGVTGAKRNEEANMKSDRRVKEPSTKEQTPLKSGLSKEGLEELQKMKEHMEDIYGEEPSPEEVREWYEAEEQLIHNSADKYKTIRNLADANDMTESEIGRRIREEGIENLLTSLGFKRREAKEMEEKFEKAASRELKPETKQDAKRRKESRSNKGGYKKRR